MLHKTLTAILMVFALINMSISVIAQETDQDVVSDTTLEEVTSDSEAYYGRTVMLEGVVEVFLNTNTFVLGEGVTLDNDQVLVINNSGETIPPNILTNDRVVVAGIIHPSLEARQTDEDVVPDTNENMNTGDTAATTEAGLVSTPTMVPEPEMTADPQMTPTVMDTNDTEETDAMAESSEESMIHQALSIDLYYAGEFPDDYDNFTVLEITSVVRLERLETDE